MVREWWALAWRLASTPAAMGTAYLYEDGSRAAPYAALSMTMFGVMTVVFTSIRPLGHMAGDACLWITRERRCIGPQPCPLEGG